MHSPQHHAALNPASNADVLLNNVGTLYTFCPLTLQAKEWIEGMLRATPTGSGMPLSSSIATLGGRRRHERRRAGVGIACAMDEFLRREGGVQVKLSA